MLSDRDWHFLKGARDFKAFLNYLATTVYGPAIPAGVPGDLSRLASLERSLSAPLLVDYAKVARSLRGNREKSVVFALFARFEGENLKILSRCVHSGLQKHRVSHLLYPLGRLSRLPWDDLWEDRNIQDVVSRLSGTPFGRAMSHALPRYEVQGNLFPLEMAVDLSCFRQLDMAVSGLKRRADKEAAREITGSFVDILNILWIIRLRRYYRLSPEEIVNYSLPGGTMSLSQVHRLARAEDLNAFLQILPGPLGGFAAGATGWKDIRPRLEKWFLKRLSRVYVRLPFNIGVPVAYLLEKEMELREIISAMEMRARSTMLSRTTEVPE